MVNRCAYLLLFCYIFFCYSAQAEENKLGEPCPAEIKVEQKAVDAPQNWKADDIEPHHFLINAGFYDGDPIELASLVPDKVIDNKKQKMAMWQLSSAVKGYWISCEYINTSVALSRQLDAKIKSCAIEYKLESSQLELKKITCK